jgi:hypothetical protein
MKMKFRSTEQPFDPCSSLPKQSIVILRSGILFKPFVYRINKFVYPTNAGQYEKQNDAYNCPYSESKSNRIHGLSP